MYYIIYILAISADLEMKERHTKTTDKVKSKQHYKNPIILDVEGNQMLHLDSVRQGFQTQDGIDLV